MTAGCAAGNRDEKTLRYTDHKLFDIEQHGSARSGHVAGTVCTVDVQLDEHPRPDGIDIVGSVGGERNQVPTDGAPDPTVTLQLARAVIRGQVVRAISICACEVMITSARWRLANRAIRRARGRGSLDAAGPCASVDPASLAHVDGAEARDLDRRPEAARRRAAARAARAAAAASVEVAPAGDERAALQQLTPPLRPCRAHGRRRWTGPRRQRA